MWRVNGLLTSACDYFHKLREIFLFPGVIGNCWKTKRRVFDFVFFPNETFIYLKALPVVLKLFRCPYKAPTYRPKVIDLCVWLPSSFLTWMLDRKNRTATWRCGNCSTWTESPPRISRENSSINSLGLLIIVAHKFAGRCYSLAHQLMSECSPQIYNMPGQDDDDRDLY